MSSDKSKGNSQFTQGKLKNLLEEYDRMERDKWQMDSEKSQAVFVIQPFKFKGEKRFHYSWSLEIRPYPDPFSFGGIWCSGGTKTRKELDKQVAEFNREVEEWRKHGLVKVEIKEEGEREITERYPSDLPDATPARPKNERTQMALF